MHIFGTRSRGRADQAGPRTQVKVDRAKAELGKWLFHDTRLSKNDTISCASCHDLSAGGDDGRVVSIGMEGRSGVINSPTVFNAGFNFKQFWDGRAHTLTDQMTDRYRVALRWRVSGRMS